LPFFHCPSAIPCSPLPFPYTVAFAIAAAVAYLFALYGCNGVEVSYVIFTEQQNFTTAEWRNSNGRMTTECWKPGITALKQRRIFSRAVERLIFLIALIARLIILIAR